MKQPTCMVCGLETHLFSDQQQTRFVCEQHIMQVRNEFAWGMRSTTLEPYDGWITTYRTPKVEPVKQPEREKGTRKAMTATNKMQAEQEGKEFARQFKALIGVPGSTDFETISDFAAYYAQSVIGYTDAERANGWTKGFITGWLKASTTSSSQVDLSGVDPVELALALLQRKQTLDIPALPEKAGGE